MEGKAQGMKIWQKLIVILTLAFALVIFTDGFKITSLAESGTTKNAVKVRKQPTTTSDVVTTLEKGKTVELGNLVDGKDSDKKKWYEVTVNGASGYIRSDLVTVGATSTTTPDVTSEVEPVTPVGAKISSEGVRVRTNPDAKSANNILSTESKDTEVTVIGKVTGTDKKVWYQVKLKVSGKDVVGYIRSDFLALTGEIKPVDSDPVITDPVITDPDPYQEPVKTTDETETNKRYETKLIDDVWYILDFQKSEQYKIDQLFGAAEEYKKLYEDANKKAKSGKGWIVFLIILVLALAAAVAYLIYRLKDAKEEAYIAAIENNTPKRTAERPRGDAKAGLPGNRPAIRDGLEPKGKEEQRPANGQRTTGNRQPQPGQRPAGAQPGQGQRPVNGQPGQGQRPAGPQPGQGQRPVNGQPGQRPTAPQPGQGQRPVNGQPGQRPAAPQPGQGQRPVNGQPGQRPAGPQPGQRPAGAQPERPMNPQPQQAPQSAPARPKNFVQDGDDMEFEFLNWDSDE